MPALTFDDVPASGASLGPNGIPRVTIDTAPKAPGGALTFDDIPTAETAGDKVVRHAKDVGLSIVSGLDKGVAGLAGLPADAVGWGLSGRDLAQAWYQGRPFGEVKAENEADAWIPRETLKNWGSEAAHDASPLKHKPQTTTGKYVHSAAEFVPSALIPGASARNALALGVIPGLASEAAGQATEGTAAEPWARAGAALAAGGAGAWFNAPSSAGASVSRATRGANQSHVDQAEALFQAAQDIGIPITRAEAIQHVTGGATNMGNLQRVIEGSGEMRPFFARRQGQVDRAARQQFDEFGPQNLQPSQIGPDVATTARQAVLESPEGRILGDTLYQAGPRVTPEQAGNTIQTELRGTFDRREGMRAALADQDYTAARNAPATIPTNGGHRVAPVDQHFEWPRAYPVQRNPNNGRMQRMTPAEEAAANLEAPVPVHPVTRGEGGRMRRLSDDEIAAEQARRWGVIDEGRAANQQRYNIREELPIVGERATEFAQVDVRPVLQHLDDALDTAKGAVRQGLQGARSTLMKADGTLDTSVAGLHNARVAIDDLISQAKAAQAPHTASRLMDAKKELDRALEAVPAYGQASRNFRAASEPLAPFGRDRAPGKIVERDQFNENFTMPADRAPRAIQQGGPSAARDFNEVATPAAREAFEQHIVTQVLDEASKTGTDLSAASIRRALQQNEDVLRQYPGVRDRLESIAIARDGLARVEASPLGQIAQRDPTTKKAINALFPRNPLAGSEQEIAEAVGALAQRSPRLARDLVRLHVETVFNQATRALATGANEYAGAGFAAALRGNSQQAANLDAAIRSLPNGAEISPGFGRLMEVLEATGTRQRMGSTTAFNTEALDALKAGGSVAESLKVAATGGLKLPQKVFDTLERWRMGKNVNQIADILTNPEAGQLFRQLATAPSASAKAAAVTTRLVYLAERGRENSKAK